MQVANTRKIIGPLAQAFAGDPWQHLQIIGITGTNGKTTTATLLYELLSHSGKAVSLLGTVSKRILDREIPSTLTTSDPIELANDMQAMVNAGSTYLVMEVSSHALDQYRVNGIPFTIAIFTNITHDHLDYHGDIEAYMKAKKKLFDDLKPGSWSIINADDPHCEYMVKDSNAQIFSIGLTDNEGNQFKIQLIIFGVMPLTRLRWNKYFLKHRVYAHNLRIQKDIVYYWALFVVTEHRLIDF